MYSYNESSEKLVSAMNSQRIESLCQQNANFSLIKLEKLMHRLHKNIRNRSTHKCGQRSMTLMNSQELCPGNASFILHLKRSKLDKSRNGEIQYHTAVSRGLLYWRDSASLNHFYSFNKYDVVPRYVRWASSKNYFQSKDWCWRIKREKCIKLSDEYTL